MAQKASVAALRAEPSEYGYMIEKFRERRDLVFNLLQDVPGFKVNYPEAAFYFFPDISYYLGKKLNGKLMVNADDFAMFLLENAHVGTVGGVSFGNPHCIRFSYAASEAELMEAMRRIKDCLENAAIE